MILKSIPIFLILVLDGLDLNKFPSSFSREIIYSLQSTVDTPFPTEGLLGTINIGGLIPES